MSLTFLRGHDPPGSKEHLKVRWEYRCELKGRWEYHQSDDRRGIVAIEETHPSVISPRRDGTMEILFFGRGRDDDDCRRRRDRDDCERHGEGRRHGRCER
jgi:hypothetical protein